MEIAKILITLIWLVIMLLVGLPCLIRGVYFTFKAVLNNEQRMVANNRFTRFNVFNALFVPGALNEAGVLYRHRAGKNLFVFVVLILITAAATSYLGTL